VLISSYKTLITLSKPQEERGQWKLQLKKQNGLLLDRTERFQNRREIVFLKTAGMTNGN